MASFELDQEMRSINGGAVKYDIRQMLPQTSAVSGVRPGAGAASGITTFQWTDDALWWVPALSYFTLRGHFLDGSGDALARPPTNALAYCDNWTSTLFSQVQLSCNSTAVELLQFAPQADTALLYSTVDKSWLGSFGSGSGVGQGFMTRCLNAAQFGTAAVGATNYNEVVATFRPSISLMDRAKGVPPGAQWRFDFSWSSSAEQNMIESVASKVAGTDYTFTIDEFTFYKASLVPDPALQLAETGLIELNPVQVNLYPLTAGTQLQVQVPLQGTTHRILVAMQDNNTANNLAAGQNGLNPITSFSASASSGATDNAAYIQNLYMNFPDLGIQAPNPTYTFTAGSAAGAMSGWERAYQDWCAITRGSSGGYEGSVPFGSFDSGIGAQITQLLWVAGTPALTQTSNLGDPNNDQKYVGNYPLITTGSLTAATVGARTAKWGWLGRCPGPIFAFPCVRAPDQKVSVANLFLTMSAAVTAVNVFVISTYSMAIACERDAYGKWKFEIVRGV